MIQINLTGAQGTGKSSVRAILERHYRGIDLVVINEVVRTMIANGKLTIDQINKDSDDEVQSLIFNEYMNMHRTHMNKHYISDRCAIDPLAYTLYMVHNEKASHDLFATQFKNVCDLIEEGALESVFYIPIEFGLVEDGVRDMDSQFQADVDKNIFDILKQLKNLYPDFKIYTITGNVFERVEQVTEVFMNEPVLNDTGVDKDILDKFRK